MAADWKSTYLAALEARDAVEKANQEIYDAYSKLADRSALLSRPSPVPAQAPPPEPPKSPPPSLLGGRFATRSPSTPVPTPGPDSPSTASLRAEFATAQAERARLSTLLAATQSEVATLQASSRLERRETARLTKVAGQLQVRLRDRDEELRGKAKLLEDVQDENATLNLELRQADERAGRLKAENRELVERWMVRKGEEAESMNRGLGLGLGLEGRDDGEEIEAGGMGSTR